MKTKIMFNWRTHATKTFDKTKPKAQPNTPEIQRSSLSLAKTIFTGTAKLPSISIAKMHQRLPKNINQDQYWLTHVLQMLLQIKPKSSTQRY